MAGAFSSLSCGSLSVPLLALRRAVDTTVDDHDTRVAVPASAAASAQIDAPAVFEGPKPGEKGAFVPVALAFRDVKFTVQVRAQFQSSVCWSSH